MRRGLLTFLGYTLGGIFFFLSAQEPLQDTTRFEVNSSNRVEMQKNNDSVPLLEGKEIILADSIIIPEPEFKPNPTKSVIYSAIFPGLGQFYNRKYWKLPIVIGGALGITYAITWNGRVYGDYNQAFRDLVTGSGTSYENYLRPGQTANDNPFGGREGFQNALKRKKDFFRRNRDLAIIAAVGVYALCMIDAYVDAQLYDFDMSPDLTMRVTPVVWGPSSYSRMAIGLQCNIIF